jgi:UDP-N-acetylmuramoylalanine--D-glutamate ligase
MANFDNQVSQLTSWYSSWQNKKTVVIGIGKTGFSVADTLQELGCDVFVLSESADPETLDILDVIGVKHEVSTDIAMLVRALNEFEPDLIIVSPGIRPTNAIILHAKSLQVPIWTDVDLAWVLRDKFLTNTKWVCITGTNGKTTTTELVESMFLAAGIRAAACGNIGIPILNIVRDPAEFEVLIVELSSFQLHYLNQISPESSAVLNIAEDHYDWHGSKEDYVAAKGKIYQNTRIACVYNSQDSLTEELVEKAEVLEGARAIGFGLNVPAKSQIGYVEDILVDRAFLDDRENSALEILSLSEISNLGALTPHLLSNIAAATALARSLDVPPSAIREAIQSFKLSPHRIQLVLEKDEVRWIDDSKATNAHAASASLSAFERVIWILGGLLKGVDISSLVQKHGKFLRAAIVIGTEREEVLEAFRTHCPEVPIFEIVESGSVAVMTDAVRTAKQLAKPGDTVVLAPAAASMDQFVDYEDRGNQFQSAVFASYGISS